MLPPLGGMAARVASHHCEGAQVRVRWGGDSHGRGRPYPEGNCRHGYGSELYSYSPIPLLPVPPVGARFALSPIEPTGFIDECHRVGLLAVPAGKAKQHEPFPEWRFARSIAPSR